MTNGVGLVCGESCGGGGESEWPNGDGLTCKKLNKCYVRFKSFITGY